MNQNGISNIYIDQLMNKISWSFRGTFSANNIPKFNDKYFSSIVNLSNEGETGTHFIAIFITENKILYFDSLGSFQINPNIKTLFRNLQKTNFIRPKTNTTFT